MKEVNRVVGIGTLDLTRPAPPVEIINVDDASVTAVASGKLAAFTAAIPSHLEGDTVPSKIHAVVIRPGEVMPPDGDSILKLRAAYGFKEVSDLPALDGIVPDQVVAIAVDCSGLFRGRETSLPGVSYAIVETFLIPEEPAPGPDPEPLPDPVPA